MLVYRAQVSLARLSLWWKLVCDILWAARRHEYHVLGDAAWEVQENDVCEALHSQIIVCV